MLNSNQYDILQEIINIGMGEAAASLSSLIHAKISIKTPEIEILSAENIKELATLFPELGIHVSQSFNGNLAGQSLLCYSRQSSCSLLEVLTGEKIQTLNFSNQQISILEEVGNIILGSCITVIANIIENNFQFEIPQVGIGIIEYLNAQINNLTEYEKALMIKTEMLAKKKKISGHIIIFLKFDKLMTVIEKLEKKINQIRAKELS